MKTKSPIVDRGRAEGPVANFSGRWASCARTQVDPHSSCVFWLSDRSSFGTVFFGCFGPIFGRTQAACEVKSSIN
jgi:hypothetical protein